jgi:putative ABC transport system ATP-binding protein
MQRIAIARALILEPQLILADEPTGNLDSDTGKKILTLLRALCDNHAHTVIMVTHDLSAAAIGDRRVFLKDGRIVGDDRVSATHPAVKVAE